jgi:hypothetical protein
VAPVISTSAPPHRQTSALRGKPLTAQELPSRAWAAGYADTRILNSGIFGTLESFKK